MAYAQFSDLIGKTLVKIEGAVNGNDEITFVTSGGEVFKMYHSQDCCERVVIDDVVGDIADLIGTPIRNASEDTNSDDPKEEYEESFTWTFYNIYTSKGHVTIKWYGASNGFYSEGVDF
jgi:hypothetical protein